MAERHRAPSVRQLTEAEAHPSMVRPPIPPVELSEAATETLMPLPVQGWARRTCRNLLPLVTVLWAWALWDAVRTKDWETWAVAAALGLLTVYMATVRFDSPKHTDRQVHVFAAAWTAGAALLFVTIGGYAYWLAGA